MLYGLMGKFFRPAIEIEHYCLNTTLSEIYYLWVLAGGDIMSELRRHGLMVSLPPILTLPSIMLNEGHPLGLVKERCALYDPIVMVLPMNQLLSCLSDLTVEDAYPLLSDGKMNNSVTTPDSKTFLALKSR